MNFLYSLRNRLIEVVAPVGPLALRLWLAQEFARAGVTKLAGGFSAPEWFASLAFPFPVSLFSSDFNWAVAGGAEILLGLMLLFGLFGRVAAAGLIFITYVAIYSVHFDLGWQGWEQIETDQGLGFKVPLMMVLMLVSLLAGGMGRWSVDAWWKSRRIGA